ncbi:MAG: IS4 family transposase, partial [Gammaproteobacteria bacterium]|nr:IS4 family transposase [Gammaproteobacteria bacterium]
MQAREVLHNLLMQTCGEMHIVRREALETMVWAGIASQRMTVTGLDRAIRSRAREKHNIKRADRLLSNRHLQVEREAIYEVLVRRLVGRQRHPVLLVDWSDLDEWRRNQVLRVSLAVEGRALTVYEEVHGRNTAVKPKTHERFLQRLRAMLPAGCRPIVVTDAGFKTPWFQAVESLGWYRVSRVRERRYVKLGSESEWLSVKSLYAQATATPRSLGEVQLARSQAHRCQLVIYKGQARGRREINRYG